MSMLSRCCFALLFVAQNLRLSNSLRKGFESEKNRTTGKKKCTIRWEIGKNGTLASSFPVRSCIIECQRFANPRRKRFPAAFSTITENNTCWCLRRSDDSRILSMEGRCRRNSNRNCFKAYMTLRSDDFIENPVSHKVIVRHRLDLQKPKNFKYSCDPAGCLYEDCDKAEANIPRVFDGRTLDDMVIIEKLAIKNAADRSGLSESLRQLILLFEEDQRRPPITTTAMTATVFPGPRSTANAAGITTKTITTATTSTVKMTTTTITTSRITTTTATRTTPTTTATSTALELKPSIATTTIKTTTKTTTTTTIIATTGMTDTRSTSTSSTIGMTPTITISITTSIATKTAATTTAATITSATTAATTNTNTTTTTTTSTASIAIAIPTLTASTLVNDELSHISARLDAMMQNLAGGLAAGRANSIAVKHHILKHGKVLVEYADSSIASKTAPIDADDTFLVLVLSVNRATTQARQPQGEYECWIEGPPDAACNTTHWKDRDCEFSTFEKACGHLAIAEAGDGSENEYALHWKFTHQLAQHGRRRSLLMDVP